MSGRGHETIDHTADMGIRGWGAEPREAFEEAAAAMFDVIADTEGAAQTMSIRIEREAPDLESLLVEFLNEVIAQCDLAEMIPIRVDIGRLTSGSGSRELEARVFGAPVADLRERLLTEVKAATYYGALVRERAPGDWEARCVIDL